MLSANKTESLSTKMHSSATSPTENSFSNVSIKREKPKSKLYETFQKVRRNTFISAREEGEKSSSKSLPPASSGTSLPRVKPKYPSRNVSVTGEKVSVPVVNFVPPSPITNEEDYENGLAEISREKSLDSINDHEIASRNPPAEPDSVISESLTLRPSTKTNFSNRFPEIDDALLQCKGAINLDQSCAWERDILWQGRLYITKSSLCFYSKIFGNEVKLILRFNEISSIEKSAVVGLIPNSITIFSKGQRYFFASFMKRDSTFEYLNTLWANSKMFEHCESAAPEMRAESVFENHASSNLCTSTRNSTSLPPNSLQTGANSNLDRKMHIRSSLIEVCYSLSLKEAIFAFLVALIAAIIVRYSIWNWNSSEIVNVHDEMKLQAQMHIQKESVDSAETCESNWPGLTLKKMIDGIMKFLQKDKARSYQVIIAVLPVTIYLSYSLFNRVILERKTPTFEQIDIKRN